MNRLEHKYPSKVAKLYMIFAVLAQFMAAMTVRYNSKFNIYQMTYFAAITLLVATSFMLNQQNISLVDLNTNSHWRCYLRGFTGSVSMILWLQSNKMIPASQAFTIFNMHPLVQLILFRIFLGYEITCIDLVNFAIGFTGIVLILKPSDNQQPQSLDGYIVTILATLVFALAIMSIRLIPNTIQNDKIIGHFAVFWTISSAIMQLVQQNSIDYNLLDVGSFVLLGIFAMIQQYFLVKACKLDRPTRLNILSYLGIVFGILVDKLIYKYSIDNYTYLGSALIILTAFINYYKQNVQEQDQQQSSKLSVHSYLSA